MSDLKPGDRVTSPLLVGEWVAKEREPTGNDHWWITGDTGLGGPGDVCVPTLTLTRVPPKVTEPPVGSVVWANGQGYVNRGGASPWYSAYNAGLQWSDLAVADDLSPMVPVSKVAEWLDRVEISHSIESLFRAEFGWPKDGAE